MCVGVCVCMCFHKFVSSLRPIKTLVLLIFASLILKCGGCQIIKNWLLIKYTLNENAYSMYACMWGGAVYAFGTVIDVPFPFKMCPISIFNHWRISSDLKNRLRALQLLVNIWVHILKTLGVKIRLSVTN